MKTRSAFAALLLGAALAFQGTAALAVNPDEVLSDPVLEKRARTISGELRCMVCQNESIDDSNAELARDLRILVRDRLKEGDSDEQVMDFIVDRYGEFVLLKPRLNARTVLLWGFPVVILLIGAVALVFAFRGRKRVGEAPQPLTESEKAELSRLLDGK
ncbi:cytochrome c-type biogenesis protein [Brucella sp. RRSP16]|uniref:Cytochrome c-type biogenesis protein n=2 Tax=Brucella intermedia TaxID=94625 RepID=C4WE12_9HYPH|nr:cytochrome c-type biogenesis protein [Brucella intermedia]EEQ95289.1 Cytochrome c-type biogenesis protein ccl2 precursor [Brucella intermedia LMG 3301]MDL2203758.1 cytochrome c-type biogenesis protein CcmH [Brucella intermedia]QNQ41401.1 cytochrome c-type biogenesis protein CcmH [Brucella intermedia]UXO83633.1 cytochrome c-type biogenesis protein CcmH [Brucella intermedia]WGJ07278.1 cytochrome c-type biogenesis protein CcmH [Brucella intermedia]